jgi:hypothetical protein
MKTLLITLTLCLAALPAVAGCYSQTYGNRTYWRCDNGTSGNAMAYGNQTYYNYNPPRVITQPPIPVVPTPQNTPPRYSGPGNPFGTNYPSWSPSSNGQHCTIVRNGMFSQRVCN